MFHKLQLPINSNKIKIHIIIFDKGINYLNSFIFFFS